MYTSPFDDSTSAVPLPEAPAPLPETSLPSVFVCPYSVEIETEAPGARYRVRVEGQDRAQVLRDAMRAIAKLPRSASTETK